MTLRLLQTLYGKGSRDFGRELCEVLATYNTAAADLDVLIDQNPIAAMDRLDRIIERLEGSKRLALMCRSSIAREREVDHQPAA